MIPEEHRDNPDQINPEEVQVHRVHQVVQADLHRVHQVVQADLHHQIDLLLRVHQVVQAGQADRVVQVVIEIEARDPAEAEVHDLEKMNNAMIDALN